MKKSLWIAAAAMAVGYGMSAHAVTNAVTGAWSFEDIAAGTAIPSATDTALPEPYGTWSADTNNGVAYITNESPSGVSYPIAGTHDKSLYFDGGVTNHFDTSAEAVKRFNTDFLLKPGQLEDLSLLNSVDNGARLAFYFDTNGWLNLLHGDSVGNWQTSTVSTVQYASNAWVRVTIDQDYDALIEGYLPGFSIYVNGTNVTHTDGYTRDGDNFTSGGGAWFIMKNGNPTGIRALVGMGIGMLDDVVNSVYSSTGPTDIEVLASTFSAAYGSISPAGTQTIVDGTPKTFTLTVAEGVAAYVLGLKVGETTLFSNADQSVRTQSWDVTYANATALGTNVVALFAAKSGSSADWLDNAFTIGEGGDYATFAEAAAADADGDGFTNMQEAICGTDPEDAASYLKIDNITINALGNVVVTFQGSAAGANSDYHLYAADTVDGTYASIATEGKDAGTQEIVVTPSTVKKFYKVVVPYTGE